VDAAVEWAGEQAGEGVAPGDGWAAEAADGCQRCLSFKAKADLAYGQARYWQVLHGRAVEREAALKARIEELQAQLHQSERQLFGEKSERSKSKASGKGPVQGTRQRGQQRGAAGHGRRRRGEQLASVEEVWDLDAHQRCCAQCQRPYEPMAQSEDSEIVEVEVRAHRRMIRRKRYRPTCQCPAQPGIVTAPGPAKLIAKGSLGISVWVAVLIDKYLFQRPTYRWLADLRLTHGVTIAQGTLTDGLQRLLPLFEPVREAIVEKSLMAKHWHADETGWPVYVKREGKSGYRWQLWVFQSREAAVFQVEPQRAGKVVQAYFGESASGILSVDRCSAYKVLRKSGRIVLAYCWAHVRRDFVRVARDWGGQHQRWALGWVECIGELYRLNAERLRVLGDAQAFTAADGKLRQAAQRMAVWREAELADAMLTGISRKVLKSMANHWTGLVVFLEHPEVPMDNNTAERAQRNPVVGRKNYYGSGAEWSGKLAATMFSIFQTLLLWKLNPRLWLHAYLEACAHNGGRPPTDLSAFLPWEMSAPRRRQLSALTVSRPDSS
jgi:transposase